MGSIDKGQPVGPIVTRFSHAVGQNYKGQLVGSTYKGQPVSPSYWNKSMGPSYKD